MATRFCRHIRINGERCGSPALNSGVFCYFHVQIGKRHTAVQPPQIDSILHPMTLQDGSQRDPISVAEPLQLNFPPLEDRHSIQLALSMLITALAQDRLDPRRAATILYGLQIASANAKDLIPPVAKHQRTGKVRSTVLDTNSGTLIAPDEDPDDDDSEEYKPMGTVAKYILQLDKEKAAREQAKRELDHKERRRMDLEDAAEDKAKLGICPV
jgi:hypothetical protein